MGTILLVISSVVTLIIGGHRLLTWMEHRGWIFYRSQGRPMGVAANAMLELETLVNPPAEHVLEYRRHGDLWIDERSDDAGDSECFEPLEGVELGGE